MESERVIVIGAGPAGLAASIQLKRYGISPRIFERDSIGGLLSNANLVENYPGFPGGVPGRDLVRLFETQFHDLSLQLTHEEVLELDYRSELFTVRTDRGAYSARIVLVASGTMPRTMTSPATPAELRDKIYYEVYPLSGRSGAEIAILGSGDAAFDYALNLARSNQVYILNRGDTVRCLPLLWERARVEPGIHYYDNITVLKIEADGAERLQLDCRRPEGNLTLRPHALIAAFGRDPQLGYLTEKVRTMATSLEVEGRLYFIGDVVNGIYRQTSIAVGNGVLAAMKIYRKLTGGFRMKILGTAGKEEVAIVYIAEMDDGNLIEFVEALQPPLPREEKWVLLVSTMYGCPVGCKMCDAGGYYHGKVSKSDILAQIDHLIRLRFPDGRVPSRQLKIQFARMGEPSFNPGVLGAIDELPERYDIPGFMPSISTIAPRGVGGFFEKLLAIKKGKFSGGRFQFQFSIHTTDEVIRDEIIPVKKWGFAEMAEYGEKFYETGDRKITLNFALAEGMPVDPGLLLRYFSPEKYLIKITPLNPTYKALESGFSTYIDPHRLDGEYPVVRELQGAGYQTIVSIGEVEENYIGSNCGQYVRRHLEAAQSVEGGYTYPVVGTR